MTTRPASLTLRGLFRAAALLATVAALPALAAAPLNADKVFAQIDANKDGSISTAEWAKAGQKADQFANIDANHDGVIVREELRAALDRAAAASASPDTSTGTSSPDSGTATPDTGTSTDPTAAPGTPPHRP